MKEVPVLAFWPWDSLTVVFGCFYAVCVADASPTSPLALFFLVIVSTARNVFTHTQKKRCCVDRAYVSLSLSLFLPLSPSDRISDESLLRLLLGWREFRGLNKRLPASVDFRLFSPFFFYRWGFGLCVCAFVRVNLCVRRLSLCGLVWQWLPARSTIAIFCCVEQSCWHIVFL